MKTKLEQMKELVTQLNAYRDAYYNRQESLVSDHTYDDMYDSLEALEAETGITMANSPTQSVGYEVKSKLTKVKHSHPMLSLGKTKDEADLIKFAGNRDCVLSCKMDGCFNANAKVRMADGKEKKIKDVEVGDEVLSFDENGNVCKAKVIHTFNNGLKPFNEWCRIIFDRMGSDNRKFDTTCTKNHKIYTPNGYVEAGKLKAGDKVYNYSKQCNLIQKQVILGMLLGDGFFVKRGELERNLLELHYSKTKANNDDYIIKLMCNLFKNRMPKLSNATSGYSKIKNNITNVNFHTVELPYYFSNPDNELRCGLTFTEEICSKLNPLSLAILYIDDGSRCPCQEDGNFNTPNIKVRSILHTNRHKLSEVVTLSNYLKSIGIDNNYHLEKKVVDKELGDGYVITITTEGTEKFYDLICKYIPVQYRKTKLGMKDKWQNCEEIKWWEDNEESLELVENTVKEIVEGFPLSPSRLNEKRLSAYDLEVEGTHAYFANDIAVHNCTILLTYEDGKLVQGETRGNGSEGELITDNAKVFDNIPLTIPYTGHFEIEGEAIVDYDTFNKINANLPKGVEPYKNPRNLASGSVRQLDSKIAKDRHIKFVAWKVPTECGDCPNNFMCRLLKAREFGFEIVPMLTYTNAFSDKENLHKTIDTLKLMAKGKGYPIDGLVMTYADIKYGESLGVTSHSPKHSIAFKFYDDVYTTEFIRFDWTMGKSGVLTPTAVFKPVEIDGTMVERASMHNVSIAESFKLRPGDEIEVYKANMIIPQLERNLNAEGRDDYILSVPYTCPVCGGSTQLVTNGDTTTLECTNPDCKGKLLGKLVHFCSKDGVNIDGLSESTLEKFIELGWVSCFEDIYKLYLHPIESLEGFGHKSAQKLVESIEKSKTISLDKFICALSIPLIGRTASKTIAKYCHGRFDEFTRICENYFDFTKLDDFGDTMDRSISDYLDLHYSEVQCLAKNFTFTAPEATSDTLSGKTFVITGSLNVFANRDEAKSAIEKLGGKVSGSVSAKTYALVNNDKESTSSKNKKAKELGIPIITEKELIDMIGGI